MKKFLRTHISILFIIFLAIVMRFIALDKIPNGINGDEIIYPVTAKAVYLTGNDISGTWNPLSAFLFTYPKGERQAELPYFLHILFSGAFPFSLFTAKFPFAILSVGSVVLLYLIAKELFGKNTAVATGLLGAINPWLVVMGRTAFETTPATFFYLLGFYIVLTMKSWRILFSLLPFVLAFYSYIGTKLIFVPFIFLSILMSHMHQKNKLNKYHGILFFISLLIVGLYFVLSGAGSSNSRLSELLLPNQPYFSSEVNQIRKTSIQSPWLSLFINKYTLYGRLLSDKLLRVLSPSYLFAEGDQFFLPARHSFFYIVDTIFLLSGLIYIYSKKRNIFFALGLFVIVGTFPHIFHNSTSDFSVHNTLAFPFLLLLTGAGIVEFIQAIPDKFRKISFASIVVMYVLSLGYFCTVYFYQYPLQDSGDFHMRLISKYLSIANISDSHITMYSNTSTDFLKKYIFYSNNLTESTIRDLNAINPKLSAFNFNGITFSSCDRTIDVTGSNSIHIVDTKCGNLNTPASHIQIARLTDAGDLYDIYNDTVCSQFDLKQYPTGITINDFSVEKMSPKQFCETFVSK